MGRGRCDNLRRWATVVEGKHQQKSTKKSAKQVQSRRVVLFIAKRDCAKKENEGEPSNQHGMTPSFRGR